MAAARIDWPDVGRLMRRAAAPVAVWMLIFWWLGFEAVATFVLPAIAWIFVACVPFAFVHVVTNGR